MKKIMCQKLHQELEALEEAPFPGPLGQKIHEQISKTAWNTWISYQTMLISEYQLNMMDPADQTFIREQMGRFLFEEKSNPNWGYEGNQNPENWGDLCEDFKLCKTGLKQSPINIQEVHKTGKNTLKIHYQKAPLKVKYNDHSLYVHFGKEQDQHVLFNQMKYQLIQLHFHAPSEHWLKDEVFPLEVHFVHQNEAGEFLVIGVFIREGAEQSYLKGLFKHIPFQKDEKTVFDYDGELNPVDLLPQNQTFYHYTGSLTTPPCSEEVTWIVMDSPIEASKTQIEQFKNEVIDQNIRPIQKINGRKITINQ